MSADDRNQDEFREFAYEVEAQNLCFLSLSKKEVEEITEATNLAIAVEVSR